MTHDFKNNRNFLNFILFTLPVGVRYSQRWTIFIFFLQIKKTCSFSKTNHTKVFENNFNYKIQCFKITVWLRRCIFSFAIIEKPPLDQKCWESRTWWNSFMLLLQKSVLQHKCSFLRINSCHQLFILQKVSEKRFYNSGKNQFCFISWQFSLDFFNRRSQNFAKFWRGFDNKNQSISFMIDSIPQNCSKIFLLCNNNHFFPCFQTLLLYPPSTEIQIIVQLALSPDLRVLIIPLLLVN